MDFDIKDKLTILVITYNRYPRLARLVKYYQSLDFPVRMHVLDSSKESAIGAEFKELIAGDDRIEHIRFSPETPPATKQHEGLKDVTSPYVVVWADDDFMVPSSFQVGVCFLEENPDFSIVHGQSAAFGVGADGTLRLGPYSQRAYEDGTASARLVSFLSSYSVVVYSVHRTEALRKNMGLCSQHELGHAWGEFAPGGLSAIQGKIGKLNQLYMVKEIHSGMDSWQTAGRRVDRFDWVTGNDFASKYYTFRECLAEELARQDGIALDEARLVVKQAFWSYLAQVLTKKLHGEYPQRNSDLSSHSRQMARRSPVIRKAWHKVRSFLPGEYNAMSLPALLRPTSRYHSDFMPIYRAITTSWDSESIGRATVTGLSGKTTEPSSLIKDKGT